MLGIYYTSSSLKLLKYHALKPFKKYHKNMIFQFQNSGNWLPEYGNQLQVHYVSNF